MPLIILARQILETVLGKTVTRFFFLRKIFSHTVIHMIFANQCIITDRALYPQKEKRDQ